MLRYADIFSTTRLVVQRTKFVVQATKLVVETTNLVVENIPGKEREMWEKENYFLKATSINYFAIICGVLFE